LGVPPGSSRRPAAGIKPAAHQKAWKSFLDEPQDYFFPVYLQTGLQPDIDSEPEFSCNGTLDLVFKLLLSLRYAPGSSHRS
jgi:hypothetical protein